MKPALTIGVADLHSGTYSGSVGLRGADVEDSHYTPTPGQVWLARRFGEFTAQAKKAASGRLVFLFVNGDLIHGNPHDCADVFTRSLTAQRAIAEDVLAPLVEIADYLFIVRGTETHTGQLGQQEEEFARDYYGAGPTVRASESRYSWYECEFRAGGVLFNVAHHAPGGNPRTAAIRVAESIKSECDDARREPPALVFRAHRHLFGDSGANVKRTRCVIMPALTLRDSYAHRIGARPADVGAVLIETCSGRVESLEVPMWTPPKARPWEPRDDDETKRAARARDRGRAALHS